MPDELNNPLLQQAQDQLEAALTPENRADYEKVVAAGMHVALDKGLNGLLSKLAQAPDPIKAAAQGAVGLVLILEKEAAGKGQVMPRMALVPAAATLLFKALDFLDRSKIVAIREPEMVRAAHIFTDFMFARSNITKQGLAKAGERVHALTQDPDAMQKINFKAGVLRHPMSATPTPLPPGPAAAGAGLLNRAPPG